MPRREGEVFRLGTAMSEVLAGGSTLAPVGTAESRHCELKIQIEAGLIEEGPR
jgi:hypothetical protein